VRDLKLNEAVDCSGTSREMNPLGSLSIKEPRSQHVKKKRGVHPRVSQRLRREREPRDSGRIRSGPIRRGGGRNLIQGRAQLMPI